MIKLKVKCTIQNHIKIVQTECDACCFKKYTGSHLLIQKYVDRKSHLSSLHFCNLIIQLKKNEIQKSAFKSCMDCDGSSHGDC